MKNIENEELQIVLDSIVQALSDIKEELSIVKDNSINREKGNNEVESALTADLLSKISETIEQAKKAIDKEDLQKFLTALIGVTTQLQEEANKASAEFLNQKIAEFNELVKRPTVVENKYSIDFKSSKTFIAVVILCLGIGVSLYFNYNQSQENRRLKHNDIKYRYVQMKGGVSYNDIIYLNKSYAERAYYRDSIVNQVIEFERLVRQKAYNESVKEQKEEDSKQIDKRLKELAK